MSWDDYIDNLVTRTTDTSGKAHTDKACIIGLDDGNVWTTATHPLALNISKYEAQTIAECFRSKDFSPVMIAGIHVDDIYYIFIKEENGRIAYARTKLRGITMQATKSAVIVAHTPEGSQQGNTNVAVAEIAEYLEGLNL